MLVIISALFSQVGNGMAKANAGIAFIYLFMVVFSFGWTPMCVSIFVTCDVNDDWSFRIDRQAIYPAEVLGYEVRAKGLAFLSLVTQIASLINTFG